MVTPFSAFLVAFAVVFGVHFLYHKRHDPERDLAVGRSLLTALVVAGGFTLLTTVVVG